MAIALNYDYTGLKYTPPPAFHISMGTFMRLWKLLEKECHQLDLELAQLTRGEEGNRAEFTVWKYGAETFSTRRKEGQESRLC